MSKNATLSKLLFLLVVMCSGSSFVSAQSGSLGGSPTLTHESGRPYSLAETSWLYQPQPRLVFKKNDIIHVRVQTGWDYTNTANQQRKKSVESEMRLTSWFKLPKVFGLPAASTRALPEVGGELDHKTQNRGTMQRREALNVNLACKVVSVQENGNLVIEGTHKSGVDEESKTIFVSGIARPADIVDNQIDSSKMAEFRIENFSAGTVTDTVRRSWGARLLEHWKPF